MRRLPEVTLVYLWKAEQLTRQKERLDLPKGTAKV